MHLHPKTNGIFLLLLLSMASYCQQSDSKTLLWRISGRGLQKPSYLYGTMHLNDKRLFKFGDSVYNAIEQSEGLAIEVNPDEMAAYTINKLFDQLENSKKLQDILKEADFKKYSTAMAKKFNKPANEITAADIVKEKNKWMNDYMEKGEMPTFVDAYMYNIARRQGKWLGGIEDITDQAGLLEDMVDKSDIDYLLAGDATGNTSAINRSMDKMIELYTNQDLEGIEAFTNDQSSPEKKDRILTKRNLKMARRIDSLINLRTMFLAIGAAHLPGDSGVIYLLRKRGFMVDPVFSSRKIDEKDYSFKEVRIPWCQVDDAQGLYQTFMPGNPATVKLFGLVEMKFLMDIFNMSAFCTMAVVSAADFTNKDSVYNTMARRMFQTEQLPSHKTINSNGIQGREYFQVKKGANIRLQVFLYNRVVYLSFMYSMKQAPMYASDANKFFTSFIINKTLSLPAIAAVFTDSVMGIRFTAPAAVTYNKKLSNDSDEGWKISAFTGNDIATGAYIMVYSKEVKPGHYVPADSLIYNDFNNNINKQYHVLKQEESFIDGCKAIKVSGRSILQPDFYINAVNILQNGRDIVIITVSDSAHLHSPAIDRVFGSLQLIPHPARAWKQYAAPGNRFSCQAPAAIQAYTAVAGNKDQFYSYDSATSVSYSIIPDTMSKYFWAKDDSSYWKKRVAYNLGEDSLVQELAVMNGDRPGVELLTKEGKNLTRYKRMRLLQDGDQLYKLFVSAEKDFLYSASTDSFFSSFRINAPRTNHLFNVTPKTERLLSDLAGEDSASRREAYTYLPDAPFTEKDREALQEALLKKYYSLYDSTISTTINDEIAGKLVQLKNNASVEFVKARYGLFTDRKDTLKNICLSLLAKLHTRESYAALGQLLQQSPPGQSFDYSFTASLTDSLGLTVGIYPVLQQLAADSIHATSIAGIANTLIDSGFIQLDKIRPAETDFINAAGKLLKPFLKDNSGNYSVYQLLTLLGRFNTAASNKILKNYLAVKSPWLQKEAALELIKNTQPVPIAVLNSLAADKSMRYSLYNDLKDIKKKALFPARYLTQAYFAEAAVYNAATDDDEEEIDKMVFLFKKTARYKGKPYVFYLYKVVSTFTDEPAGFLGIAGGYSVSGAALEPAIDISGIYRGKNFDAKNTAALLAAYIKGYEKDNDETIEE